MIVEVTRKVFGEFEPITDIKAALEHCLRNKSIWLLDDGAHSRYNSHSASHTKAFKVKVVGEPYAYAGFSCLKVYTDSKYTVPVLDGIHVKAGTLVRLIKLLEIDKPIRH